MGGYDGRHGGFPLFFQLFFIHRLGPGELRQRPVYPGQISGGQEGGGVTVRGMTGSWDTYASGRFSGAPQLRRRGMGMWFGVERLSVLWCCGDDESTIRQRQFVVIHQGS